MVYNRNTLWTFEYFVYNRNTQSSIAKGNLYVIINSFSSVLHYMSCYSSTRLQMLYCLGKSSVIRGDKTSGTKADSTLKHCSAGIHRSLKIKDKYYLVGCWSVTFLPTSDVISRWTPTCHSASAQSWLLYSAASLRDQAGSSMNWYPILTLSWHSADQFFPYPNNAECLARKW